MTIFMSAYRAIVSWRLPNPWKFLCPTLPSLPGHAAHRRATPVTRMPPHCGSNRPIAIPLRATFPRRSFCPMAMSLPSSWFNYAVLSVNASPRATWTQFNFEPPRHQDAKFLKSNQQSFDYFGVVDLLSPIQVSSAFSPLIFNNEWNDLSFSVYSYSTK